MTVLHSHKCNHHQAVSEHRKVLFKPFQQIWEASKQYYFDNLRNITLLFFFFPPFWVSEKKTKCIQH